jgi:hypothetical protein
LGAKVKLDARIDIPRYPFHGEDRNAVSVVIVNWNGRKYIQQCLTGLGNQTFRSFTVIFVDNGSSDGSLEWVSKNYPQIRIIALKENCGFAKANNIALDQITTQYVSLLNNDAVPHPQWLANLINVLKGDPEAGFAASKMLFYHAPDRIDRAGDAFTTTGAAGLRGRGKPSEAFNEREYVFGACAGAALYRTEMLRDIGFFDEDFFILYEDVDLSFRAQLRGYRCIYVPNALVYHVGAGSIGEDSPTSVYFTHRNLEWVYIKNMPAGLMKQTIMLHLIYDLAAFLFFMAKGRGGDYLRAKRDALKGVKTALQKREQIQMNKKVGDDYVWSLFEKKSFFSRLTRRLERNRS